DSVTRNKIRLWAKSVPANITRPSYTDVLDINEIVLDLDDSTTEKAGRVLSGENERRVREARTRASEVVEHLDGVIASCTPDTESDSADKDIDIDPHMFASVMAQTLPGMLRENLASLVRQETFRALATARGRVFDADPVLDRGRHPIATFLL